MRENRTIPRECVKRRFYEVERDSNRYEVEVSGAPGQLSSAGRAGGATGKSARESSSLGPAFAPSVGRHKLSLSGRRFSSVSRHISDHPHSKSSRPAHCKFSSWTRLGNSARARRYCDCAVPNRTSMPWALLNPQRSKSTIGPV